MNVNPGNANLEEGPPWTDTTTRGCLNLLLLLGTLAVAIFLLFWLAPHLGWSSLPASSPPIVVCSPRLESVYLEPITFRREDAVARVWVWVTIRGRDLDGVQFRIREDRWRCQ